jgi:hypothetical protein
MQRNGKAYTFTWTCMRSSFTEFPCMLHEWLKRQVELNLDAFLVELIVWDQAKLDNLKVLVLRGPLRT